MSKISAEIIADSICNRHRITTMKVVMPRIILAEFNTHRMLSKNSASSRAIPFPKMVEMVKENPFIPIAWQKNHTGMQGTEYFNPDMIPGRDFPSDWLLARDEVIYRAERLYASGHGATKQICNRLLEPFMWHTVLVTATEWENFFHLRCPQYETFENSNLRTYRSRKDVIKSLKDFPTISEAVSKRTEIEWLQSNRGQAEIHMMALAEAMWDARNESKPKELRPGQWHMPYGDIISSDEVTALANMRELNLDDVDFNMIRVRLATARCAQTSYTVVGEDGKPQKPEILIDVHNSLLVRPYTNRKGVVFGPDDPIHTSPAEHCAQAMTEDEEDSFVKGRVWTKKDSPLELEGMDVETGWCHNLRGWKSYRSMIPNENRR